MLLLNLATLSVRDVCSDCFLMHLVVWTVPDFSSTRELTAFYVYILLTIYRHTIYRYTGYIMSLIHCTDIKAFFFTVQNDVCAESDA